MVNAQKMWDDAHATAKAMLALENFRKKHRRNPTAFEMIEIHKETGNKQQRDQIVEAFLAAEASFVKRIHDLAVDIAETNGLAENSGRRKFIANTKEALHRHLPRDPQLIEFLAWAKENPETEENQNGN